MSLLLIRITSMKTNARIRTGQRVYITKSGTATWQKRRVYFGIAATSSSAGLVLVSHD